MFKETMCLGILTGRDCLSWQYVAAVAGCVVITDVVANISFTKVDLIYMETKLIPKVWPLLLICRYN